MTEVQWYPGHMTKARRMMEENIRIVDLVIEILDARVPLSSGNPDIDKMASGKSRILILGKADLADPAKTKQFEAWFRSQGFRTAVMDSRDPKSVQRVKELLLAVSSKKAERDLKRGILNRPVRAMICGIPNVGKSTFINSLAGRASAKTGNRPGVTTGRQWISVQTRAGSRSTGRQGDNARGRFEPGRSTAARSPRIEVLDTPGLLWPKFDDRAVGIRLALAGSVRDEILDETELAMELVGILGKDYPELFLKRYDNREGSSLLEPEEVSSFHEGTLSKTQRLAILGRIAASRSMLAKGSTCDAKRAAHVLIDDFRSGRIGRITLDEPPVLEEGESE